MIFSSNFFKRHTWHLFLYVFFITPLISESVKPINFSIDPVGNTVYSLDPYLPSFQQDIHVFDIRLNGELGLPLSTFVFDLEETPVPLNDSLRTRSTFHFIKGDYIFRDLSMKTQSLTLNKGTLTGFAHTRSYNGVNGYFGDGSLMQNYLLSYKNNFKNSKLSLTAAYHNEDMDVPIRNIASAIKVNESYFSGLSLSHQIRFGEVKYLSDLQVSKTTAIDEIDSVKWISNQSILFKFSKMGKFTPFLKWSENGENQNISRFGVSWGDSLAYGSLNLAYISSPQFEFTFGRKFKDTYIQIERKILDDYTLSTKNYILNSLILGITKKSFYAQLVPSAVILNSSSFNSYEWTAGYENEIFILKTSGRFYDNNESGIKHVLNSNMQVNFPYFERYTPYLKTEYIYRKAEDTSSILNSMFEIHMDDMNEIAHRLNFEFGFNLETFKISYHFKNILGEEGRFTNNYEQVPIHKYLKVEWKFRN